MKITKFVLITVTMASSLVAHGVNIFTFVEGDSILCQCYYNDGSPVRNQTIEAFRSSGVKLLEGQTDDAGYFKFAAGVKEDLKVVLHAGMGHKAETVIKASSVPEVMTPTPGRRNDSRKTVQTSPETIGLDEEQLRRIVKEVMEEEINSIRGLILRQQRSVSLTTIIGGIGYIFGIFGILLYFKRRKQN
ncbi:MAG: hypothetical protein JSU64_07590 [candidate division WOR-3 bacterium]|nr:MAG: hypothetical protein JSU64_07590 [candidate division WOR-3 bacterium]